MTSKAQKADFRFKQFSINQDRCAMKVGVEAVAFGAWCSVSDCESVLDVGCGTGILSLMIAQRNDKAQIVGLEVDRDACGQANENFKGSPWTDRLSCDRVDFREFKTDQKFDVIVSNPPFFKEGVLSASEKRNVARFESSLPLIELVRGMAALLKPKGKCCFLLPIDRKDELIQLCVETGLHIERMTTLQSTPKKSANRVLAQFGQDNGKNCVHENLLIYSRESTYTDEFKKLTQEFYLNI